MERRFVVYVSQNILGMIGLSAYVLADTYFIAAAEGARGIAALNLVLPLYCLIYAIGHMLGVGSATRFRIIKAQGENQSGVYLGNALGWTTLCSVFFMLAGGLFPEKILAFLGASEDVMVVGIPYTRIFMMFAPFFMYNCVMNAFVRNDNNPTIAMVATFASSIFNIVMDYILMFPMQMGMSGAALATAFSPIVGVMICMVHVCSKKSSLHFKFTGLSVKKLIESAQLGVSALVGEISGGVITLVFNVIILNILGDVGVAAYGVIANTAIVVVAIYNGIAQGSQPLLSEAYGKGKKEDVKKLYNMGVIAGMCFSVLILIVAWSCAEEIVSIFNKEENVQMAAHAVQGMHIYYVGFLFSGFNIITTSYLSATAQAVPAMVASVLRGFVAIIISAILLAVFFGMNGVWAAYAVAEAITMLVVIWLMNRKN